MIDQQAFTRAADDIFLVSAVIFIGLISMLWLTQRPAPLPSAAQPLSSACPEGFASASADGKGIRALQDVDVVTRSESHLKLL